MQFSLLTEAQKLKVKVDVGICAKDSKIPKDQVELIRDGKFDNINNNSKCFIKCVLEKTGLVANDHVNSDFVNSKLSPAFGVDLTHAEAKCDSLKGSDSCDTAFQIYKCYYENKVTLT